MVLSNIPPQRKKLLSFFLVLTLTTGLVVVLFDEASAVSMSFSTAPTSIGASGVEYVVDVVIPNGQRVPITSIDGFLEVAPTGTSNKAGSTLLSQFRCNFGPQMDCNAAALQFISGGAPGVQTITRIRTIGFLDSSSNTVTGYHGYGELTATGTGYGYVVGSGHGYVIPGGPGGLLSDGYGYGYALAGDALTIRIGVTVNGAVLAASTHFLTVQANTGSGVFGTLSSPFTQFNVVAGGGGGGGGGSGPGGPGPGGPSGPPTTVVTPPAPQQTVVDGNTVTQITVPTVGLVPAGNRLEVPLTGLNPALKNIQIDVGTTDLANVDITIQVSDAPTPGATAVPNGFGGFLYMDISVRVGGNAPAPGALANSAVTFTLTDAQLAGQNPQTVTAMHGQPDGSWEQVLVTPQPKAAGATSQDFQMFLGSSFSPFAIAFDQLPPVIDQLRPPDGGTATTSPVISARLADNRAIDTAATTMSVDGQRVAATVTSSGITFSPSVPLTEGEHTVTVTAVDLSGFETTETWTFDAAAADDSTKPSVTVVRPADDGFTNNKRPVIEATYTDNLGIDPTSVTVTLDGQRLSTPGASATRVSATPASDLQDGVHNVRVTVADTSGNEGVATWSFTVDTVQPLVTKLEPADGANVAGPRPTIRATLSDALSGIDASSVAVRVDGKAVDAQVSGNIVTVQLSEDLPVGEHTVEVGFADNAGNTAEETWTFSTETGAGAGFPTGLVILVVVLILVVAGAGWYFMAGPGKGKFGGGN